MDETNEVERLERELRRARSELRELNKIGMALMSERNPDKLLGTILSQARALTTSDAGSLYLVEEDESGGERLHFLRAQNDSLPDLPQPDFTLPLDRTSIAGYAASTVAPLIIDDVYEIPKDAPYTFNRSFDVEHGYRAKSMLVVPMRDHRDRVVGVLQLINRKVRVDVDIRGEDDATNYVLPYTDREVELVQSLAGQAAVSIENGQLYRDIENLFEGFITAAVTAIDQRDPTTSGHSLRVTELTMGLAHEVNRQIEGPYSDVHFTDEELKELRYAGLLHDFGKVGVREEVLVKPKKLTRVMWTEVQARFERIRATLHLRFQETKAAELEAREEGFEERVAAAQEKLESDLERVERYWKAVAEANEPRPLPEEGPAILEEIHAASVEGLDGEPIRFITDEELEYLQIKRGSLSPDEVEQIQNHVVFSYQILQNIPWTDEFDQIVPIVRGHHEKLNGRGYPDGISGDEIRIETRMMTIADIFDALTAADRPYKKAMPLDRALSILEMEADEGALDPHLVDLFISSKVYERVLDKDWRELL